MPTNLEVVEGQEFYIVLTGNGVGGYIWAADADTKAAFSDNIVGEEIFYSEGLGGSTKYIKMKFDSCSPPQRRLIFKKSRPWQEDYASVYKEYTVMIYPKGNVIND